MPVSVILNRIRRCIDLAPGLWRVAAVGLLALSTWAGLVRPPAASAASAAPFVALPLAPLPAAVPPAAVTLAIHAGFDGYYKTDSWLPVRVTVANDGPDTQGSLRVSVPRASGGAALMITRDVDLPTAIAA